MNIAKKPNQNRKRKGKESKKPVDQECPINESQPSSKCLPRNCCALCPILARNLSHAYRNMIRKHPAMENYARVVFYIAAGAPSDTLSDKLINSWARQRLVAASSRRTEENVASRRGSGKHWRKASRARLLSLRLKKPLVIVKMIRRGKHTEESSAQHA